MTEAQIYWLITLPKLANGIGEFLLIVGGIATFGSLMIYGFSQADFCPINWKDIKKPFVLGVLALTTGALMKTFIPSTKELVAIYGIPKVVNNEQIQAIPEKLLEFANIKLDDLVEEAKK